MSTYYYKTMNQQGTLSKGIFESDNYYSAIEELKVKESFIIYIKERKSYDRLEYKANTKDLAMLCRQLYSIHKSGVLLADALDIVAKQFSNTKLKRSLINIRKSVIEGESLYLSMYNYRFLYSEFFINMISVGEESGNLLNILNQLSLFYEGEYKTKQKIKTALTYPLLIFVLTLVISVVLIVKVVPIFAANLKSMGAELPLSTNIMLGCSEYVSEHLLLLVLALFCLVFALTKILYNKKVKRYIHKLKLVLPIYKAYYYKLTEIKFAKIFKILLASETGIISALELSSKPINNLDFEKICVEIIKKIKEGYSLTEAMKSSKIFSEFLMTMIYIGEETGNLEELLEKAIMQLDIEFNELMERLLTMLQPMIMLLLSLIVGSIVTSILLPMFKLMNAMAV